MFTFKQHTGGKLDPLDDQILQCVNDGCSLQETAERVGKTVNGVKWRMQPLIQGGYIVYTPRRARARQLTDLGREYMRANGLLEVRFFER